MVHSKVEFLLWGGGRVVCESGKAMILKSFLLSFHCCFCGYTYIQGLRLAMHSYVPVNERCRRQGVKLGTFSEWWVLSVCLCVYT